MLKIRKSLKTVSLFILEYLVFKTFKDVKNQNVVKNCPFLFWNILFLYTFGMLNAIKDCVPFYFGILVTSWNFGKLDWTLLQVCGWGISPFVINLLFVVKYICKKKKIIIKKIM